MILSQTEGNDLAWDWSGWISGSCQFSGIIICPHAVGFSSEPMPQLVYQDTVHFIPKRQRPC